MLAGAVIPRARRHATRSARSDTDAFREGTERSFRSLPPALSSLSLVYSLASSCSSVYSRVKLKSRCAGTEPRARFSETGGTLRAHLTSIIQRLEKMDSGDICYFHATRDDWRTEPPKGYVRHRIYPSKRTAAFRVGWNAEFSGRSTSDRCEKWMRFSSTFTVLVKV